MFKFKIKRTDYAIETDEYQYILKKRLKDDKNGEEQYSVLGYYKDLFYLLSKLVKMGAMSSGQGNDLDKFIRRVLNTLQTSLETAIEALPRHDHD